MKYDLTKHALIEDHGDLIASFNPCIPTGRAFKILDDLNNARTIVDLELDYNCLKKECDSFERDVEELRDKNFDLKKDVEALDDRLRGIITMLEESSDEYSKEELIKEVIDICAAPF